MSEVKTDIMESPIKLTPGALVEIQKLMVENKLTDEHALRIGVKGGGCSGLSYILGFDTRKDGDAIYQFEGVKIYIDSAHGMYLAGMEIDYVDGLENRGFTFNNPNASDTCGCGSSFSA